MCTHTCICPIQRMGTHARLNRRCTHIHTSVRSNWAHTHASIGSVHTYRMHLSNVQHVATVTVPNVQMPERRTRLPGLCRGSVPASSCWQRATVCSGMCFLEHSGDSQSVLRHGARQILESAVAFSISTAGVGEVIVTVVVGALSLDLERQRR